ncbi:MAG: glycosyltransferase [Cyclobacteriaceae bacterium]|jgi:teichuronic acid biosynthesis glycosyltransferase TuaH
MQTKHTYLFFSLPKHDDPYTSTPWQLARELAQHEQVIYVDHPYHFWEAFKNLFSSKIQWRLKSYVQETTKVVDGVTVLATPFVWPTHFLPSGRIHRIFTNRNERLVAKRVNAYLLRRKISSLVYVNSFEFYFPTIQHLLRVPVHTSVYHCIDPMVKKYTLKHGPALQQAAAANAQLIITTAPALQQQFFDRGFSRVYCIPNAANFQLFHQAVNENLPVHPRLPATTKKTIGYLGNIERRIDFQLVLQVLDALHDFQLVMAGPVETTYVPTEAMNHPRIHWIGPVAHEDAPAVVKGFDVAIIPFVVDQVSESIYPLKLFEYLAAGKPVVATPFNQSVLVALKDVVYTAHTAAQFAQGVQHAAASTSKSEQEKRVSVAKENTWHDRAKQFKQLIQLQVA